MPLTRREILREIVGMGNQTTQTAREWNYRIFYAVLPHLIIPVCLVVDHYGWR